MFRQDHTTPKCRGLPAVADAKKTEIRRMRQNLGTLVMIWCRTKRCKPASSGDEMAQTATLMFTGTFICVST